MFTKRLKDLRRLFTLGAALLTLLVLVTPVSAQNARAPLQPTTAPRTTAASSTDAPGALERANLWAILGGLLAVTGALPSVRDRDKRNGTRDRSPDPSPQLSQPRTPLDTTRPVFPNYIQLRMRSRLSPRFWALARFCSVTAVLIYVGVLFADPAVGLFLFWRLTIPLLPLLFLVAPGLWRNVCPLAASNQTPRLLKFSRALTPPKWLKEYGFVIGMVAFFLFASSRKWLFNSNGPATGLLILFALASALLGGYLFKGKSGWCSSICPLYPVQRLYNRTPIITVPNAHCDPCVGCTKNCYDFNPGTAYLADLYDDDRHYTAYRKLFAAAMPGFIVAFFTAPDATSLASAVPMYLQFALYMVLSIGVFSVLDSFLKLSANKLTAIYGAAAFNLFYWFGLPGWLKAVGSLVGMTPPIWLAWALQSGILAMTIVWIARTYRKEPLFLSQRQQEEETRIASGAIPVLQLAARQTPLEITFAPSDVRVSADAGHTLLEIAESNQQPIQAGCRMGVCGADPILIVNGMENLAPMGSDEKSTLARLGLGPNCRLACMCRPTGSVTISLDPKATITPSAAPTPTASVKESVPIPVADVAAIAAPVAQPAGQLNQQGIMFMPNEVCVPIEMGHTLLEIAENNNQPIEAGCRMGICGADPVLIMGGMENLAPAGKDERNTLERLGLGPNCRMACMCRVKGPVTASLDTKGTNAKVPAQPQVTDYDRNLKSVVIIGNGAAGITAADTVRRHHPECEIHLVSREKHHFYNRMAITRLIYGRSAMSGLYMQTEAWYDERKITCWLNTHATHINRGHKQVSLATGETLTYDRLILASGSSSYVPQIPGYDLPGTFVVREAEDAMEIRAYVQRHQCRTAVIAGGGLLGLETAYALHKMGLSVWVLERGEWLLRRQLDERGAHCLKQGLEAMGLVIETQAEAASVEGEGRVSQVTLKNGLTLPCDVFLVAAGIQPNVDLARTAGLRVNRGVLVDETMRTNAPDIFAAGDVCEFAQQVPGLWGVAVEQAKVAAINAVGGQTTYKEIVPMTILKVVGIDMTSIGRFEARSSSDIEIAIEDQDNHSYRKLVIADGKIVGAILLGRPMDAPAVTTAIKEGLEVSHCLDALRAGQWDVLQENGTEPVVVIDQPKAQAPLHIEPEVQKPAEALPALEFYRPPQPSADTVKPPKRIFHTLTLDFRRKRGEVGAVHERIV